MSFDVRSIIGAFRCDSMREQRFDLTAILTLPPSFMIMGVKKLALTLWASSCLYLVHLVILSTLPVCIEVGVQRPLPCNNLRAHRPAIVRPSHGVGARLQVQILVVLLS